MRCCPVRFCEKCDRRYPDDYSLCPQCGTLLADRPDVVDRQRVLLILRGLPGYKIILENRSFQNDGKTVFFDYIVLHEAGIFVFQICDSYRFLEGNGKLRYWTVQERYGSKSVFRIERPVTLLEKDHIFELISFGVLNATVNRHPIDEVEVIILGQAGEHLRTIKPDDYVRQI